MDSNRIIAIFTVVLAFVAVSQCSIMRQQTQILNDQTTLNKNEFSYTHRPHLRLRFAKLGCKGSKVIFDGESLCGEIDVLNNGQDSATITESDVEFYVTKSGLPPQFPDVDESRKNLNAFACNGISNGKQPCELSAGSGADTDYFKSRHPVKEYFQNGHLKSNIKLFLIGWIKYSGTGESPYWRYLDFAKQYNPKDGSFVDAQKYPDYRSDPDSR